MKVGSLFSGIGGIDLAFQQAGASTRWFVEIDGQCRNVLAKHFRAIPRYRDIRFLSGGALEKVDVIAGGFPCQDVSIAGYRAGLAGKRSGLWWDFHGIVGRLTPAWVFIENVTGLLSSNGGRDMGAILGSLGELGYGWAYRVLDAAYFGVPQHRERVFIVGHLGNPTAPAQVLFESEDRALDSGATPEPAQTTHRLRYEAGPRTTLKDPLSPTITVNWARQSWSPDNLVLVDEQIRRFTPLEAERLQGFPDRWTDIGIPDKPRYAMLGNSVAVPVVRWIAERMMQWTD